MTELAEIKQRLRDLVHEVLDGSVHPKTAAAETDVLAARLRVMEMRTSLRAAELRRELTELEESIVCQ